jgi:hypothetical protein
MTELCRKHTLGDPLGKEDRAPSPKRLEWLLLSGPEKLDTAERVALD